MPALITLPKSGRGAAMAERLSRDALHQEVRPLTHEAMLAFFDAGENVHLNRHGINVSPPAVEHYELEVRRRRKAGEL